MLGSFDHMLPMLTGLLLVFPAKLDLWVCAIFFFLHASHKGRLHSMSDQSLKKHFPQTRAQSEERSICLEMQGCKNSRLCMVSFFSKGYCGFHVSVLYVQQFRGFPQPSLQDLTVYDLTC